MKRLSAALAIAAALLSVGCQRDNALRGPNPQYGTTPTYQPSHYAPGYAPATSTPQYAPARNNPSVGQALTPWGVVFQLPQIPMQLPPLPSLGELIASWPFPWQPPQGGPPTTPPPQTGNDWPAEWVAFEDAVLRETNAWRARGAICGGKPFGPTGPLTIQLQLRDSARGHSGDMSRRNYFDHETPEGVGPMQRAKRAGYPGGFVGENIAAGQRSPREVVQAWIDSPGHCLNIMEPRYRFLGVGYVHEQNDRYRDYWTQNFGG